MISIPNLVYCIHEPVAAMRQRKNKLTIS